AVLGMVRGDALVACRAGHGRGALDVVGVVTRGAASVRGHARRSEDGFFFVTRLTGDRGLFLEIVGPMAADTLAMPFVEERSLRDDGLAPLVASATRFDRRAGRRVLTLVACRTRFEQRL